MGNGTEQIEGAKYIRVSDTDPDEPALVNIGRKVKELGGTFIQKPFYQKNSAIEAHSDHYGRWLSDTSIREKNPVVLRAWVPDEKDQELKTYINFINIGYDHTLIDAYLPKPEGKKPGRMKKENLENKLASLDFSADNLGNPSQPPRFNEVYRSNQ